MIVVVFRSKLRPDVDQAELAAAATHMLQLASDMPGFLSYTEFGAADGESLAVVEFATLEDCTRWRDHPAHRAVQQRGRDGFFSEYRVQVCEVLRDTGSA